MFKKIKNIINEVNMDEGLQDIKAKYFPDMEQAKFNELVKLDPTYKGGDNAGNYSRWVLNLYNKNLLKEEDFYKVDEYLREFEQKKKYMSNKDIFKYKTLPELSQALREAQVPELSNRQKEREIRKKGIEDADLVYEDDEWTIYIPRTKEASCNLGTDTRWCTATTSGGNMYQHYADKGELYIIISKKNPEEKYQFHFETGQFMDRDDREVNIAELIKDESFGSFIQGVLDDKIDSLPRLFPLSTKEVDLETQVRGLNYYSPNFKIIDGKIYQETTLEEIFSNERSELGTVDGDYLAKLLSDDEFDEVFSELLDVPEVEELLNDLFSRNDQSDKLSGQTFKYNLSTLYPELYNDLKEAVHKYGGLPKEIKERLLELLNLEPPYAIVNSPNDVLLQFHMDSVYNWLHDGDMDLSSAFNYAIDENPHAYVDGRDADELEEIVDNYKSDIVLSDKMIDDVKNIIQKYLDMDTESQNKQLKLPLESLKGIAKLKYINEMLEEYLCEDIEGIKKYFPKIEDAKIKELIALDPTYKNNDNLGKFGKWILTIYNKGNLKEEDFYKVEDYLQRFIDNQRKFQNKDINQFKSLPELVQGLKAVEDTEVELTDRQKQRELKRKGEKDSKIVFENENWTIYVPETYEASCKLGAGTEWCTATTRTDSYYNNYVEKGELYIVVNNNDPKDKYQFHFQTSSFMDSDDRPIDINNFLENERDMSNYFLENVPNILQEAPILFFQIEEPRLDQIREFLGAIDSSLEYNEETGKATYEENLSAFLEASINEGRDNLSASTVEEVLTGENNYFIDMDIDNSSISYELDGLKNKGQVVTILQEKGIDFKDIIRYFDENRDSDIINEIAESSGVDETNVENLLDEVGWRARDAMASGSEQEAYKDIMDSIKRYFPDFKIDYDKGYGVKVTCTLEEIKDMISKLSLDTVEYEGFLKSYVLYLTDEDLISVVEPRYGWSDFDKDYFAEEVLSLVNNLG